MYYCPVKLRRSKRFEEPISTRKTMQERRRRSQLGPEKRQGMCLVEELLYRQHFARRGSSSSTHFVTFSFAPSFVGLRPTRMVFPY